MAFYNDNPISTTAQDQLALTEAVARLAEALRQTHPPFVLGVHGDWGTGKTSALWLLRHALPAKKPVSQVVMFEPWRYQNEATPAIALLQAIRTQFSLETALLDKAGKIAKVSAFTALALLDKLIAGIPSGLAATVRGEGELIEKAEARELLAADTLRSLFEEAVKQMLGDRSRDGTGRLVVLVDDLDRCSDEATVRLLEAMKLYFSVPNVVFVIATDPRAVVRAAARVLFKDADKDPARQQALAREYCGKLIQAVWEVPVPRDLPAFIKKLWPDPITGISGAEVAALQAQHPFLPPNPRQIKRYLGELRLRLLEMERLRSARAGEAPPLPELRAVLAFQALQTFHPDLYRVLLHHPSFIGDLQRLCREGPEWLAAERPAALRDVKLPMDDRYALPTDPSVLHLAALLRDAVIADGDMVLLRLES